MENQTAVPEFDNSRKFLPSSAASRLAVKLAGNPELDETLVMLTTKNLAEMLDCSVSWIQKARIYEPHKLPRHINVGRAVRYQLSEVRGWLQAGLNNQDNL